MDCLPHIATPGTAAAAGHRWLLVSVGDAGDRWAWSGIPESVARALRRSGQDVVRVSCDLPRSIEAEGSRILNRLPGTSVRGYDWPPFVAWRSRRLRGLELGWESARVVAFGSTFWPPRIDAVFVDMTVAQIPDQTRSRALTRWHRRQAAMFGAAARCFTSTDWAAASVRDDYQQSADKVVVAGFAPNLVCRPVAKDWSQPRLLWVGLDWHRKGGDTLLAAFREAALPGATLDLVGQHPSVDVPGVTGHGLVRDQSRLRAFFESSTLFVLPSRFDASPIVCLEAATAGTPVIASRTGGTAEHVGDAGVTVEPGNIGTLAAAMRHLADPLTAATCRAAALDQARTRSWDHVAARMISSLHCARRAPPSHPFTGGSLGP